jgi:hypothetical protein
MSSQTPQKAPSTEVIRITPGSPPRVHPETACISREQEVEWECAADFEVEFEKGRTPFVAGRFNRRNHRSGKPTPRAQRNTPYKYSVSTGGKALDPEIIIV